MRCREQLSIALISKGMRSDEKWSVATWNEMLNYGGSDVQRILKLPPATALLTFEFAAVVHTESLEFAAQLILAYYINSFAEL